LCGQRLADGGQDGGFPPAVVFDSVLDDLLGMAFDYKEMPVRGYVVGTSPRWVRLIEKRSDFTGHVDGGGSKYYLKEPV